MGYVAKLAERQQRNNTGANEYGGYAAKLAERQQQKAAAEAARAEARTAELERQKNVRASSLMATLNEDGHVVLPKAGSATRTPSSSYSEQNAGILRTGFTAPDPLGTVGDVLDNIGVNQKRLEALESQPAYVDAGKDVNGRNRREYVGKDYGAINDTKSRINQQKAEFTRTAAERAAAGKTVEESRTQQLIDNRLSDAPIVRYSPTKSIDAQDMTAGQRQTYDYLYQTSPKSAKAYAESIAPEVNAKTAERESAAVKEYAKDHPVTAAGLNLFTSFANGASALDAAASAVAGKEYDPNSSLNRPARITQATQEGLTEDIKNPFVKFLADTGLSTAQFLAKLPLGQTAALAVMASGAAGQTAYDVKRSGGSTEQALLLGTIAGAAEATLEKLPLENLIGSFKGLDRTGIVAKLTSKIKQPIRDMLGSAIEEGGEEILTEYINNIADQLTRGDNSEMMQYKAQLMASGMSEAEAQKKALQQYYFINPLLSFAGGALSGGALVGIASGSNALRTWAGDRASRMLEKAAEKAAAKATADTMDEAEINAAAGTTAVIEADTGNYADVFSEVLDEEEIPQAEAWAEEDAAEPDPVPETVQVRAKTVLDDGMLPSVESEKLNKKAEAAKTDTAKSGIYAGVDEDDIRAAEYLSKVYGRKILFASDNYRINGKLENGTIYINPKGQNPVGQTLAHELMHTIEQSPDAYAQLYRVLQDVTRETGVNWSQRKEELTPIYAQVYQNNGRKFTDQDATYEVAAEVLSGMISDSKQLEAMARRNRNIVTRMWSRVKAIADRITGKYRIKVDEDTGEKRQKTNAELHVDMYIREVENAFADALRKTKKQAKKAQNKENSAKYSLTPEKAVGKEQAVAMLQEGISARQVYEQTGWFVDNDGIVRNNIDVKPDLSTPMKRRAYNSIHDTVKDYVDILTSDNHTKKYKRDLSDKLMQWYDRMSLVRDEQDYQKTNAEFIRAANEIAEEIVDSNLIKNHDNEEAAANIKAILTQPIKVPEDAKRDFHGKWGKWYSSQKKWLHQSNDNGTASDVVYMELSTEYPEYFPSDIEHPGDQLRKMAEVFELISSEDFVYDSYYDFEDGENQAEIDRQNIANMIIRGWEEINKMPRTEEEMLRDEVELAKRMNKEEYEARLRQKEAEYQRHVDQAVLTQNIEISRINEEAQNKVKETKEKYRQREEERKNREEQNLLKKRQERERRHRMRGGDISLDKIAKAIADNTFTQKMERLYAELKRLDTNAERYASIDIEKVEDKKLKKEILKARQDADDARMYIRNVGRVLKEAHRNEALEFLRGGDVEKWVDKNTGLQYSVNTMTRNIRDISRGDAKGEEMIKKYFDPISQHVATATRMKNSLRQRVADMNIKTTRNTSDQLSESAFVQLLGEARDNIYMLEHHLGYTNIYNGEEYRNGKTLQEWQDVINTLMVENPGISKNEEAMQRVENAIKEFKEIYDQLIGALNHTRILNGYEPIDYRHGYFPHYSSQTAPDGLFAELFKGLGVTPDTEDLPTTINGLTRKFRPGMQYQVFAQQRGENPGESYNGFRLDGMGAVEGFDRYIETAANVIFLTEDVQRLRALSNAIRYNASKKGIKEQIDIRRNDRNLSEDEKETVIEGLLANADTHLSNFVVELEEYTNLLAGKKSLRDREIEQYIGRGIYRMAKRLESRIAANMVALNPASWLTNFIPLTQAAAILKTGSMLGAMGETIKAVKEEDGFVARSNFLTNRYGSERLVRTQSQQLSDTLSKLMEKIDSFVAQTIVRARYAENLANGMTESAAIQDADKFAAGIMGDRSFGQTPTIFNQQNPVTKLVTQYQLEVANQLMWMTKDLRMYAEDRKKFAEIIVKYLLFSFFYNFFYEAAIGRKPAFDPLGILNDAVGDFTGYSLPELSEIIGNAFDDEKTLQERMLNMFKSPKTKPSEAFRNLATSVAENLPFTSVAGVLIDDFDAGRLPVASAIPNLYNLGGLIDTGKSAKSKAYTAYKELSKPAAYLLPPFGGGQIKKTLEGAAAIAQGGSYVPDAQGRGQLQYPVYRTNPLDIAGALVFGKSTTQGGREWVDSGFQTLSAKKTEAFQNAMEAGATRKEAYNAVKSIKGSSVSEKRQALDGLKLDGDVKASLYYDTLASEKERGVLDAMGRTEEAYTLLRDLKGVTGNARKAEILAKAKGLTESQRETAFDNMVTDAYTDRIERVKKAGAGFNDFLQVYSTFSAAVGDEKKLKTIDAIDALNLTDAQKDALYLCFYTESNLHNAPWNNSMPLFQIPEVSLPEIRLPQINIPKINLPY